MGLRTSRYALIIDDLKIRYVKKEEPGQLEVSSAEAILANI